ncbi:type VI secretion system lipoprotein TssJ [Trinickia caryophylli]|uniref:Type VI secretion system protein VasD n=1 Tax=Trinickia caryophylli TaxID=28094 RepID=A0A1X7CDA6_TRICW|nr:type VI secretion system lipoprotein TssJ [Trinickia caryophylli]PMS12543.1 type VI secretion system lipoprotein TssJ [Trinickia caryophylli]TRX19748.1 type VI secretion system lipoprotein TssJ [Trinickia caryophylli]WQE12932.1 type VI secretion system lipoprotein TssJ [Trinickia caryophylli]SME94684.1 type VI secretion system protein VasD [Trinickia caryophylli]GLU30659.1 type VI secretion system-associated lipoprotein [Trinickia caryophylli]
MKPYFTTWIVPLAACVLLGGCAAGVSLLGAAASSALQATGLGKPDVPDSQKPPRNVPLTLAAAPNLNAATDNHPLALVVRLYILKDPTSFQQASFDAFTDPAKEKSALGADLLSVREVTLIPGQRYQMVEKVSREAQAFGVVALFRDPALRRWKFAFDPAKSEKSGIMIGLHNCAMTVTNGTVIPPDPGLPMPPLNLLSSVSCG